MKIKLLLVILSLLNVCKSTKDYLSSLDKQKEKSEINTSGNHDHQSLNTDLTLSLQHQTTKPMPVSDQDQNPEKQLTRAQVRLRRIKNDSVEYKKYLIKKQERDARFRKNKALKILEPAQKNIQKTEMSVARSRAYRKQKAKYGFTGLKHRFELEQVRERLKAGLGNAEDAKRLEEGDKIRKEKRKIANHKHYIKTRKAKDKQTNE